MVDLHRRIFRNMNILQVKSIKLIHILCVRGGFWRFLPFKLVLPIFIIIYYRIFRNMNILQVKSIKLIHILCVRGGFWRFLPFKLVLPSLFLL